MLQTTDVTEAETKRLSVAVQMEAWVALRGVFCPNSMSNNVAAVATVLGLTYALTDNVHQFFKSRNVRLALGSGFRIRRSAWVLIVQHEQAQQEPLKLKGTPDRFKTKDVFNGFSSSGLVLEMLHIYSAVFTKCAA